MSPGVVTYAGCCILCESEDEPQITAALLVHVGAGAISKEFGAAYRDTRRHERCIRQMLKTNMKEDHA